MIWFIVWHLFSTLLDWLSIGRLSESEKDLEILLLRQQLNMLERKFDKPVRPTRIEKLTLAVVFARVKATTRHPTAQLRKIMRLFQPETVLKWQRDLVLSRSEWGFPQCDRDTFQRAPFAASHARKHCV